MEKLYENISDTSSSSKMKKEQFSGRITYFKTPKPLKHLGVVNNKMVALRIAFPKNPRRPSVTVKLFGSDNIVFLC